MLANIFNQHGLKAKAHYFSWNDTKNVGQILIHPSAARTVEPTSKLILLTIHLLQALLIFILRARAFSWRWILL